LPEAAVSVDPNHISDFLFHEAELLDDGRFEEWLDLFDAAGIFWIPLDPDADPVHEPSILYDDADLRRARVHQLRGGAHWSQSPPSRTIHSISNVRVEPEAPDGSVVVRCNLIVTELRSGGHRAIQRGLGDQRTIAGRCIYRLLRNGAGWSIGLKKVMLLNHDQPIENLTFII
jgi:3-phenylpropionate/cinnamic acid dioxygenase small subunit